MPVSPLFPFLLFELKRESKEIEDEDEADGKGSAGVPIGNAAKDLRVKRITPRHLQLAIRGDEELDAMVQATIAGGGVLPYIHKVGLVWRYRADVVREEQELIRVGFVGLVGYVLGTRRKGRQDRLEEGPCYACYRLVQPLRF